MEDELAVIKREVKQDPDVKNGNIDKAIELTYKKITEKWIKRLRLWTE